MIIEAVDPRDVAWEREDPVFRIYLARGSEVEEFQTSGASLGEVQAWIAARSDQVDGWSL